jgi:hypothetical protein
LHSSNPKPLALGLGRVKTVQRSAPSFLRISLWSTKVRVCSSFASSRKNHSQRFAIFCVFTQPGSKLERLGSSNIDRRIEELRRRTGNALPNAAPRRGGPRVGEGGKALKTIGLIEPCLPSPAKAPPSGADWLHEIKHDGFRILARRDAKGVHLITRNGNDFSKRFPLVVVAIATLPVRSCLIDGLRQRPAPPVTDVTPERVSLG